MGRSIGVGRRITNGLSVPVQKALMVGPSNLIELELSLA